MEGPTNKSDPKSKRYYISKENFYRFFPQPSKPIDMKERFMDGRLGIKIEYILKNKSKKKAIPIDYLITPKIFNYKGNPRLN